MSDWLPEIRCWPLAWRQSLQMGRLLKAFAQAAHSPLCLSLRKRINHLQWGRVVTKQLFPSRHTILTFLANGPRGTWAGREANRYGDFD
jgi:hypothetical protein